MRVIPRHAKEAQAEEMTARRQSMPMLFDFITQIYVVLTVVLIFFFFKVDH